MGESRVFQKKSIMYNIIIYSMKLIKLINIIIIIIILTTLVSQYGNDIML